MTTTPESLSTRLRAAADDIAFQGRPDPHDDKALLREAAAEVEHSAHLVAMFRRRVDRLADESGGLFRLLYEIAALDPDDTQMSDSEFRRRARELAQQRMAPGVGAQPGDQWTELDSLRTMVAAQREHQHELGRYLVTAHVHGDVDDKARAKLDGSDGEHTLAAALRLLKLAMSRGAYASGAVAIPEQAAHEWHQLGMWLVTTFQPGAVDEAAVLCPGGEYESGPAFVRRALQLALERGAFAPGQHIQGDATEGDQPVDVLADLVSRFGVAMLAKLRKAADQRGLHDQPWQQDDWADELRAQLRAHVEKGDPRDVANYCAFAWHHGWKLSEEGLVKLHDIPEAATSLCTGDVAPGAEAVDTRFLELFYLSGPRVGLRFEGIPDVYVPDADAHAIAATLLAGGEPAAPSWKLITRAAEYFGQRIHVDGMAGKLVLTDSSTYYKAGPGRSRAELAQDIRAAVGKLRALTLLPEDARRVTEIAGQLEDFAAAMSPVREDTSPDDPSPTGQARRALQRLGPTVAGVGGSIKLAAAIGIGPACGLSIDEFRPLLAAWNAAGTPRWADEAIELRLVDRYEQHKADFFADVPTTGPTSSEPEQDPAMRLLPRDTPAA